MRGRPRKKCISIAHYETCPRNYSGENMSQMSCEELVQHSVKTSQLFEDNCAPYNLLFQILDTDTIVFQRHDRAVDNIRSALMEVFGTLTPREERTISLLFGFDDGEPRSIFKVADDFQLTTERIGQIRNKAIRKLRHPSRIKNFANLVSADNDAASALCGYSQNKVYMTYLARLREEAKQRFKDYLNITDSVEIAYQQTLSKIYSKDLVETYIKTKREMLLWAQQMYTFQDDHIGIHIRKWRSWPSIGCALSACGISTVGQIYDLFCRGTFVDTLMGTKLVTKARAEHFAEQCKICFLELRLLHDVNTLYSRDILSEAIQDLETLSVSGKTSIVSPFIPDEYLELLLYLKYRSIEDLAVDHRHGNLKVRCEENQTKIMLGDVYDTVSKFIESFETKPLEYTIVSLHDYADIPDDDRETLIAKKPRKKRSISHQVEETHFSVEDDFDDELFDFSLFDDIDCSCALDRHENGNINVLQEVYINELSLPIWVKLELSHAGFEQLKDILSTSVSDLLFKYKIGFLAIEKLCYILDEQNFRLQACSKNDYPEIESYLQSIRKKIFEQFQKETTADFMVNKLEVQAILDKNGSLCCEDNYFYVKGEAYTVGEHVAVPIKNGTETGIGIITEIDNFILRKLPATSGNLDYIIRKAEKQEYLDRLRKYHDYWADLEAHDKQRRQEEIEKNKVAVVTRKQLYDEVWELSVAGVARKYGISYSKCISQIKSANIPTPPAGYWTKVEFGKSVEKPILSGPLDEMIILSKEPTKCRYGASPAQDLCSMGTFIFCRVLLSFKSYPYYYLAPDNTYNIGDLVRIPFGVANEEYEAVIISMEQHTVMTAPYPVERTKYIIGKVVPLDDV